MPCPPLHVTSSTCCAKLYHGEFLLPTRYAMPATFLRSRYVESGAEFGSAATRRSRWRAMMGAARVLRREGGGWRGEGGFSQQAQLSSKRQRARGS
eukprot:2308407-Rhodomonas_salina.2